ncbi:MAG TPA: phosphate ABC transporter permease subunit PstC [Jatrophihabitans sp.]|jgi:phosphate transport system permease protein
MDHETTTQPGAEKPPAANVPRGAGGDNTGADPTAPAVPSADSHLVASSSAAAILVDNGAPPVVGAGLFSIGRKRRGDSVFAGLTSAASLVVILLVVLVAAFLLARSWNSIAHDKVNFLFSDAWSTSDNDLRFGVAAMLWTTVISSLIALVVAVPVAVGIALFITQYAPRRIARPVAYIIDLLAAIPSIIYGIWGVSVLAPKLRGVVGVLDNIGLGLFAQKFPTRNVFDAGIVLAIMILPIITAISRDVFERTPRQNIEAAWALGATRWEMIRLAVLPYGRAGVVSGAMLGMGRALGETIAVMMILGKVSDFSFSIFDGGETFASKIANSASEFRTPLTTGAYLTAGLVLFVLTFIVNAAARWIVNRRKDFT